MARLYVEAELVHGATLALPPGPARHVQVLRLQPGDALTLFDGRGGEWAARIASIGRQRVEVGIGEHDPVERELPRRVTLALGMPANDRMDFVVEKATELGAHAIQPLVCRRSVLRPDGERAAKRVAHWQAVAIAAAEQSGRTRVPTIAPVLPLVSWLDLARSADVRWMLGFDAAIPLTRESSARPGADVVVLSGPEGGLAPDEIAAALERGFVTVSLGPRVLRADTAPLAALAWLGLASPEP